MYQMDKKRSSLTSSHVDLIFSRLASARSRKVCAAGGSQSSLSHLILSVTLHRPHKKNPLPPISTSCFHSFPTESRRPITQPPMAAISAATPVTCSSLSSSMSKRKTGGSYIQGLNSFDGLKANSRVSSLGRPACTAQSFAKVVSSLRPKKSKIGGGGALSSTCNAADEIFKIAAIMNGLVLVGVAVGFVLLRVEAWVEEQE